MNALFPDTTAPFSALIVIDGFSFTFISMVESVSQPFNVANILY